jgi:GntR family transcriptional repressor for pyruvate dehydrogenase complex
VTDMPGSPSPAAWSDPWRMAADSPKGSDALAHTLRERILVGDLAEGTALPSERELVTLSGSGRTTVREALRILEVEGLVHIRAGRAGGAFVRQPSRDSVSSSVGLLIRGRNIRLAAILETREAIEPICAQLAAINRTDRDIAAILAANEPITDLGSTLSAFLQANVDWHVAVATATGNELIEAFMIALSQAIYSSTETKGFIDPEVRRTTAHVHSRIAAAIVAGDAPGAGRRMNRHVRSYAAAAAEMDKRTEIHLPDVS